MSVVELTRHDGRAIGIPVGRAILIFNLENTPDPNFPKALTMIRYTVDGQQPKHAFVRDAYKHVLSCFPLAIGGHGWAHLTDFKGNDQAIMNKTGVGFEETADGEFTVIFGVPTGPIELLIKADIEEVRKLMQPEEPVPPAAASAEGPVPPPAGTAAPAKKPAGPKPTRRPRAAKT